MKTKTDFSKLPVGTKVWDVLRGSGEIINIKNGTYCVKVKFDNTGEVYCFTKEGRGVSCYLYPSLMLKEIPSIVDGSAFESEVVDERIGKKCIFWYGPIRQNLCIGTLREISNDGFGDLYYCNDIMAGFRCCELYTPERLIELAEKI